MGRTKRKRLFHLAMAMIVDFKLSLTLTSWNHHRASVHLSVKLHMSLTQIMILLLIFLLRQQNNFQHLTQTSDCLHHGLTVILTIWFKLHSVAVPKTVTGRLVSWAAWYCQSMSSHVHLILQSGKGKKIIMGKEIWLAAYKKGGAHEWDVTQALWCPVWID